jgi:hypothetical protein
MSREKKWTIGLGWVLLTAAAVIGEAQPPSARQEPTPRFRVAADGVRIDAVVTDRDGRVVSGLTAEDFEVRQDGKLQKLLFAQFVPVRNGVAPPIPCLSQAP